jgi:hypothetical protein
MRDILFHYQGVGITTWAYLSSLLTIALFFKFSRVWSVRNLDLIALILLAPGLIIIDWGITHNSEPQKQLGYIWLFSTGGFFLIRMLLDPLMVRRPLLEPNLSVGGLAFLGIALFVFLMANVVTREPDTDDLVAASTPEAVVQADGAQAVPVPADEPTPEERARELLSHQGPGYALLKLIPSISTRIFVPDQADAVQPEQAPVDPQRTANVATARTMAILSHLAIVVGMVIIGYRHFDNIKTGIAAAVLYLMLPYTAAMTGRVTHVLPAALLVWAIVAYRRPLISGVLMGLAIGTTYYPMFLLPLWVAFYWERGLVRFSVGVLCTLAVLTSVLALNAANYDEFLVQVQQMFGFMMPTMKRSGFWGLSFNDPVFRIPVLAAFVVMSATLAIWPAQKNLGTLLSCSAAVMIGTQFWNAYGGGLYMAWYLPLLLLTIFRPNLEDRIALSVLGEWRPKRRLRIAVFSRAA